MLDVFSDENSEQLILRPPFVNKHHHTSQVRSTPAVSQTGLARALSKLGFCSRSQAWKLIRSGQVRVNGQVQRDPERRVDLQRDKFQVADQAIAAQNKIYLMLNKPRGLITTTSDEQSRETVYSCFEGKNLPRVVPVGRLDKASEGLLLFTNDTAWADSVTNPETHVDKTYHIQIDSVADEALARRLMAGVKCDADFLSAKTVRIVRQGEKNSWLEIILDEGKNRHIRRLLEAFDISVLRLIRISIGSLQLGNLAKGEFRKLSNEEVDQLFRRKNNAGAS